MHAPDLVDRIVGSTGLSRGEAARVIGDVVAYFDEPLQSFVRRRHRELRLRGVRNDEVFAQIRKELRTGVIAPPELSERQVRRIIYG